MADVIMKPCEIGDVCYEVDSDLTHGVITHTVKQLMWTEFDVEYSNNAVKRITGWDITTNAVDTNGSSWTDHYTPDEWNARIIGRDTAETLFHIKQLNANRIPSP